MSFYFFDYLIMAFGKMADHFFIIACTLLIFFIEIISIILYEALSSKNDQDEP